MKVSSIIAIVDDDPGVRGSLDSLLRSVGLTCLCFASGEELLACEVAAQAACVIADLHMPGMTGLELQAEITRRQWGRPLIIMTAYPTEAARNQAMDAGAAAFLTKPIDPDTFLAAIRDASG